MSKTLNAAVAVCMKFNLLQTSNYLVTILDLYCLVCYFMVAALEMYLDVKF